MRGWLRLYIGIDTFAVYKVESSNLNSLWVYKKNPDGKIVLNYHNRTWNKRIPINKSQQLLYGINNKTVKVNNVGLRSNKDWIKNNKTLILFHGDSVTYGGSKLDNSELFSEKIM